MTDFFKLRLDQIMEELTRETWVYHSCPTPLLERRFKIQFLERSALYMCQGGCGKTFAVG